MLLQLHPFSPLPSLLLSSSSSLSSYSSQVKPRQPVSTQSTQNSNMGRSLSSVKNVVATLASASNRRGFAAVAQGVEGSRRTNVMGQKRTSEPAPWIPDPVTGYYRPENVANEMDVAELREVLLKQSKNGKK